MCAVIIYLSAWHDLSVVYAQVWSHFDTGGCPGQAVGVRTRLDNAVSGFIPLKNLSDKHVTSPEERVQVGSVHMSR